MFRNVNACVYNLYDQPMNSEDINAMISETSDDWSHLNIDL